MSEQSERRKAWVIRFEGTLKTQPDAVWCKSEPLAKKKKEFKRDQAGFLLRPPRKRRRADPSLEAMKYTPRCVRRERSPTTAAIKDASTAFALCVVPN